MKFIHLSDIRIGNNSESGTPWEGERLSELEGGMSRVMEEAYRSSADLVIISGGLYAHTPLTSELDELSKLFSGYGGMDILIIAGETDRIRRSSPVRSYIWPENVHYVTGGKVERIVIKRKKTELYAASLTDAENAGLQDFADALSLEYEDAQPVRIAVLRSDRDREIGSMFAGLKYSYAAVGSPVMGSRTISAKIRCPGFFEPDTMGDNGSHGVFEGVISESTGMLEHIEFKPMARAAYIPLLIKTTVKTTEKDLEGLIRREIEKRGASNIYRLKLTGSRDPGIKFSMEDIRKEYRISEVIDLTEPEYDFRELFAEHPQDLIGYYISSIISDRQEMSPVEKRAMFYGLEALLKDTEE